MIVKRTYKMKNKNGLHERFFLDNEISTIWYVWTLNGKLTQARERRYLNDDVKSEYPIETIPDFIQDLIDTVKEQIK